MSKLVYLLYYMLIVPFAFGFIVNSIELLRRQTYTSIMGWIFNIYTKGILIEFAIWEILFQICQKMDGTYDILQRNMELCWKMMSVLGVILALITAVVLRGIIRTFLVRAQNKKYGWKRIGFMFIYAVVSVCFVRPNQLDNTVNQMFDVMQYQLIASHHEFVYVMLASLCGIGIISFTHYILNGALLLFFFGVYNHIESLLLEYNPKLKKNAKLIEIMFAIYLVILVFIRGSLYVAIPQNIWNSSTILASVILPLAFVYGYIYILDKSWGWVIKLIGIMLSVNLFYAKGYMFVLILLVVSMIMRLIEMRKKDAEVA